MVDSCVVFKNMWNSTDSIGVREGTLMNHQFWELSLHEHVETPKKFASFCVIIVWRVDIGIFRINASRRETHLEFWIRSTSITAGLLWTNRPGCVHARHNFINTSWFQEIYIYTWNPNDPCLLGKGLLLKGSTTKIEDKQVPGIYTWLYVYSLKDFTPEAYMRKVCQRRDVFMCVR